MMGAMELRGDEYARARPSIVDPSVRVRHTAQKAHAENKERELHRWYSGDQTHSDEPYVSDRIFQDVRPVIGPEGHLLFGVMQGVDAVPPAISVRQSVTPIVGEIEDGEVGDEDDCGPCREHGDQAGKRRRRDGVGAKKCIEVLPQPIVFKVCDEGNRERTKIA